MGQFDEIKHVVKQRTNTFSQEACSALLTELKIRYMDMRNGQFLGIGSAELSEEAKIACDLKEVVRHHLAWDKTPEGNSMNVDFDKPFHWSRTEQLAKIERRD